LAKELSTPYSQSIDDINYQDLDLIIEVTSSGKVVQILDDTCLLVPFLIPKQLSCSWLL
jgi:hypothetical protein